MSFFADDSAIYISSRNIKYLTNKIQQSIQYTTGATKTDLESP